MTVGLIKETKRHEYRVGMTPDNAKEYINHGHTVLVEAGAGEGSGFSDKQYAAAGAAIVAGAKEVWGRSDMIVKVKEPLEPEYELMREGQTLFTYLHLAADRALTQALLSKKVKGVAYETVTDRRGLLPLLLPMSEIAGRLSIQEGAKYLEKPFGGKGVLLSGVPGVPKGKIVIVGGGTVGLNACKVAVGMGADVTIIDLNVERLAYIDDLFGGRVHTLYSTPQNIENAVALADLVIGAVLIPGAGTPKLIKRAYLKAMEPGSVIVDVAVDQGGCCETTHATYHNDPTYVVDGVVHYCVANMPGATPRTSTLALTNVTLRYGLAIADKGIEKAAMEDRSFYTGLNTYGGKCTCKGVADALGIQYAEAGGLIGGAV